MFKNIYLYNWRQFNKVEIEFHKRLTILTGANGAGKTTILHMLNRHWGWNIGFVSGLALKGKGLGRYRRDFWGGTDTRSEQQINRNSIGHIEFVDGHSSQLLVPENVEGTYNVIIDNHRNVNGVYVPSHRAPYIYQKVENIPTEVDAKEQIFQTYFNELVSRFSPGRRNVESPSFRIKTSLISLATFGYGNPAVSRNEEAIQLFEGFQKVLSIVLPPSLKFSRIIIQSPDVLIETETGTFSFDAVSGGISSIIDIAWQIFMYSQIHKDFVVVIDEPETHLHPALQQRFLGDLLNAFPNSQFIIATHNPFIVTSVKDSYVYVLDYDTNNKVTSEQLDVENKAGTDLPPYNKSIS